MRARGRARTSIFGLFCPYSNMHCLVEGVLNGLECKTAQKCVLEGSPSISQLFFLLGDLPPILVEYFYGDGSPLFFRQCQTTSTPQNFIKNIIFKPQYSPGDVNYGSRRRQTQR